MPLALQVQCASAEFCGRLSRAVLDRIPSAALLPSMTTSSGLTQPSSLPMVEEVQRDLSAHYGCHAIHRGAAKPLGPCIRPYRLDRHRGIFQSRRGGLHSPRYMRLWRCHLMHRWWCPRCGVRLIGCSGAVAASSIRVVSTQQKLPASLWWEKVEARASQRPMDTARRIRQKSLRRIAVCLRCFTAASRSHQITLKKAEAALPNRSMPPATSLSSPSPVVKVGTDENSTTHVVAKSFHHAVMAAKVKRNRRCHRWHSPRRQKKKLRTSAAVKVNGSPAAVQELTHHVTRAISKGAAAAKAPVLSSSVAGRALMSLIPTGPLGKVSHRRPTATKSAGDHPIPPPPSIVKHGEFVRPSSGGQEKEMTQTRPQPMRLISDAMNEATKSFTSGESPHRATKQSNTKLNNTGRADATPPGGVPPPVKIPRKAPVAAPKVTSAKKKTDSKKNVMDAMNQLGF